MKKFFSLLVTAVIALSVIAATGCNDSENTLPTFVFERGKNSLEFSVTANAPLKTEEVEKIELYLGDELIDTAESNSANFTAPSYNKYSLKAYIKDSENVLAANYNVTATHYNLAYFNATLPVTMFATTMFDKTDPTFIYLERTQTFDWNNLAPNTYKFVGLESVEDYEYHQDIITAAAYIKLLHELDGTSTFTLNVVDNYVNLISAFMYENGIPEELFDAVIWTDGAGTYNLMQSHNPTKEALQQRISELNAFKNDAIALSKQQTEQVEDEGVVHGEAPVPVYIQMRDEGTMQCAQYALAFTSQPNVTYVVNSIDGVYNSDEQMKAYVTEKLTVKTLSSMLENLKKSDDNFRAFEIMYKTRTVTTIDGVTTEVSIAEIFEDSEKPNLLVLGTSQSGEASGKAHTFIEYMEKVVALYGDEYDIFYKAHPKWTDLSVYEDGRAEFFDEHNIINIVPGTIPVELFMYFYEDIYICGYFGSSFYSTQQDQCLFFFESESSVRENATLAAMLDGTTIFEKTKYLDDENIWGAA